MPDPQLRDLYTAMRRIRSFEERVGELFVRGGSAGSMLHLSIGEEAAAAVCLLMRKGDSFTTHHRGHGICLARGGDPERMMAEIAGKQLGYCGGKGGSMHIADMKLGSLGANAIVGGGIPHSVGAAYAYKQAKAKRIAVAFFGDGAMQQGLLYESMNMAALWSLPAVFVCINNEYGMGTHISRAAAKMDFVPRARSFGLEAAVADGADAEAVMRTAKPLLAGARKGQPALLVINCYRFFGHARMDKSPYRDDKEEAAGRKRDPVLRARAKLAKAKGASAKLDKLDATIATEMDAAVEAAIAANPPPADDLFTDVYGPDEPRPQALRTRLARILAEQ